MTQIKNAKDCVETHAQLAGCIHDTAMFLQKEQLMDAVLWKRFVEQYRSCVDGENRGWRGEYWGKMMRGAVLVYEYTRDAELYETLTRTVRDMLSVIEADGRVSSYSRDTEFDGWDLWCRKYVMLGMQYYLEICADDALEREILEFLCRMLDYVMEHIGEGKKRITAASRNWLGVNSSSILEPVVRLYRLTRRTKYLDFASYIVSCGGAEGINIFRLAYENKLLPYQYGVNKAYEMMSCFEGLLEYAAVTGSEKHMAACVNFTKAVMDSDVSIIGSCGCTDELLGHTGTRQTAEPAEVLQETCVTVTWMKLCSRLLKLTGERCYADAMEQSFYNAYLGALNLHHNQCGYVRRYFEKLQQADGLVDTFLPFDSYSPLRPGKRALRVGGLQRLPDKSYYGCCTSIGAAGVGIMAKHMVLERPDGISVEFYERGTQTVTCHGKTICIRMETDYPADGRIRLDIEGAQGMNIYLRVPGWCEHARASRPHTISGGYMVFADQVQIELVLPMTIRTILPETWDEDVIWTDRKNPPPGWSATGPKKVYHDPADDRFVAFARGPLTLCADSRTGKAADSVFSPKLPLEAKVCSEKQIVSGENCMVRCELESTDAESIVLVDYASAGRDWETLIAAWLPTK